MSSKLRNRNVSLSIENDHLENGKEAADLTGIETVDSPALYLLFDSPWQLHLGEATLTAWNPRLWRKETVAQAMSGPGEDESFLQSKRYGSVMSTPNINQLNQGNQLLEQAKFNRSSSVGPGMTASTLNPRQRNLRALYVNLPFFRCGIVRSDRNPQDFLFHVCFLRPTLPR